MDIAIFTGFPKRLLLHPLNPSASALLLLLLLLLPVLPVLLTLLKLDAPAAEGDLKTHC